LIFGRNAVIVIHDARFLSISIAIPSILPSCPIFRIGSKSIQCRYEQTLKRFGSQPTGDVVPLFDVRKILLSATIFC